MSKIRGKKGFEGPDEVELENYLEQSHKSIIRMKAGKSPYYFRPKRILPIKFIGFLIFLTISSGVFIVIPLLSGNPSQIYPPSENDTSTPSTTTLTHPEDQDLSKTVENLELFIDNMIPINYSDINPLIINGTIIENHTISYEELMELIWILSQFEIESIWWDIGKDIVIDTIKIWNNTSFQDLTLQTQLKTLRSLLSYSSEQISLNSSNQAIFNSLAELFWDEIILSFDNSTKTITSSLNDSFRRSNEQILMIEVLGSAIGYPSLIDRNLVQTISVDLLETIDNLTGVRGGIPENFSINFSMQSPIYFCEDQGRLLLGLDRIYTFFDDPSINSKILSINNNVKKFINDYFLKPDWSYCSYYNISSNQRSNEFLVRDQSLLIRVNVVYDELNFANNTANTLRTLFKAPNNGFFSSKSDIGTQSLLDQVQVLLAFQDLLELISIHNTGYPASTLWEFNIFFFCLILIFVKRNLEKRKKP